MTTHQNLKQEENTAQEAPHILYIDDEPLLLETIGTLLTTLGFKVTTFLDPREAWKIFQNNPSQYDLVITDQVMDHLTGQDIINLIREMGEQLPIILLSGGSYKNITHLNSNKQHEANLFLHKPIPTPELIKHINQLLNISKAEYAS